MALLIAGAFDIDGLHSATRICMVFDCTIKLPHKQWLETLKPLSVTKARQRDEVP